jgi:hypothetical protein
MFVTLVIQVAGLGLIPYDESNDTFTGREMYDPSPPNLPKKKMVRTDKDTRLNVSSLKQLQQRSSARRSSRPTRDPNRTDGGEFLDSSDEDEETIEENYNFQDEAFAPDPNHKRPYFLNPRSMSE